MNKYLTEFIGTFFLVLTIGLVVVGQAPLGALAIGSILMVMIFMGGHVSGAHYNPAVTLAVYMRGKLPVADVAPYMIAQIIGAFVAGIVVYILTGQTFAPAPGANVSVIDALLNEIIYTFALALVVLNVATAKGTSGNPTYGLAIGFTIVVAAIAGGGISGGAYNPAVGLGPTLSQALFGGAFNTSVWIHIVGPLIGGALAALVFKVQNPDD
jgi:aquaporin Z